MEDVIFVVAGFAVLAGWIHVNGTRTGALEQRIDAILEYLRRTADPVQHLGSGRPGQASYRRAVDLAVQVLVGDKNIPGRVVDLSMTGGQVRTEAQLVKDQVITLRFEEAQVEATIARVIEPGAFGVAFNNPGEKAQQFLSLVLKVSGDRS